MKRNKIIFIAFVILVLLVADNYKLLAGAPPPPPPPPCFPPPCGVPLDGGISLLIAAGAAYGGKKVLDSRKKNP